VLAIGVGPKLPGKDRPIPDVDAAPDSDEDRVMSFPHHGCRPYCHRFLWTAVALSLFPMSGSSAAQTPLPAPAKLAENLDLSCLMLSEREKPTPLAIQLHYEPAGKNALFALSYLWTISSEDDRFPSKNSLINMRSMEINAEPTSGLSIVTSDGWRYLYSLYYGIEERFPSFYYVPDHLVVRRWRNNEIKPTGQLIGMGECHLNAPKLAH
jgi:hypothetical protein